MKEDFGLKIADIRKMQSHDRKLALEIAKLDTLTPGHPSSSFAKESFTIPHKMMNQCSSVYHLS